MLSLQAPVQQTPPLDSSSAEQSAIAAKQLHESAAQLVDLMGVRDRLKVLVDKMAQDGKERMLHDYPNDDPAFAQEWAERMRARLNIEDFVNVAVQAYERHFTNEELSEMIQAQRDMNAKKSPSISTHLQEKLAAIQVTVQSEIIGGCTQLGAKLGGDIGQEIGKQHPEWVRKSNPDGK